MADEIIEHSVPHTESEPDRPNLNAQGSNEDVWAVWERLPLIRIDYRPHRVDLFNDLDTIAVNEILSSMPLRTPPGIAFKTVRQWIQHCRTHHGLCGMHRYSLSNVWVIDCLNKHIVPLPDHPFVALSYVWGPNSAILGPKDENEAGEYENEESYNEDHYSMASEDDYKPDEDRCRDLLPRTIQDAITTTLLLGQRYLWVDRFCISHDDKPDQIQQMGAIYASAYATIIAAAGDDPSYGLPGISRTLDADKQLIMEHDGNLTSLIHQSKWASRAWTFQESYLSPRRLFFTDAGIVYACNTNSTSEIIDYSPALTRCPSLLRGFMDDRWSLVFSSRTQEGLSTAVDILNIYNTRDLTFDSDALNAVTGVLNELSVRPDPVGHFWGVPFGIRPGLTGVLFALNWSAAVPYVRRLGFPSWSPLGWRSKDIHFDKAKDQVICVPRTVNDFEEGISVGLGPRYSDGFDQDICSVIRTYSEWSARVYWTYKPFILELTGYLAYTSELKANSGIIAFRHTDGFESRYRVIPHWEDDSYAIDQNLQYPEDQVCCIFLSIAKGSGLMMVKEIHYKRVGRFTADPLFEDNAKLHCQALDSDPPLLDWSTSSHRSWLRKRTIILM